ncbi:hypothetical protein ACFQE1_17795 [Halobium palmae]|uniref:Uncharacterized protein n=1 Tax=Halobium palmae TaxID=1776492 RepID=A0ABD5S4S5_9EURY
MNDDVGSGDWLGGSYGQCGNCENYVFEEYLDQGGCPACRA